MVRHAYVNLAQSDGKDFSIARGRKKVVCA